MLFDLLCLSVAVVAAMDAVVCCVEVAFHRLIVGDALMVRAVQTIYLALLVALDHRLVLPAHK